MDPNVNYEEWSYSVSNGLQNLLNISSKFAPQLPHAHQSQEAKAEYHYNAILGRRWASTA